MRDVVEKFGTLPSGEEVHLVRLGAGDLRASFLTYGASLQDLRFSGLRHPLVLGAPKLEPYLTSMTYAGALVGRFANRIHKGCFEIDGKTYQVPCNNLGHALHGGDRGASSQLWLIEDITYKSVVMRLDLPDGHMGFPGDLSVRSEISITSDNALSFAIKAYTNRTTPCSFAHHSYFNLGGADTINDHDLQVFADSYLPVREDMIPTGEVRTVAGEAFDFRDYRQLGQTFIDHNFCLSGVAGKLRPVAHLVARDVGLAMGVETNAPGLQVYTGDGLSLGAGQGLERRSYGARAGIALETQAWPDAPNRPEFPEALLYPGDCYDHQVRYRFVRL